MVGHCLENRDHSKGWTEFDSPALHHSRFSIMEVPSFETRVIRVRFSGAGPSLFCEIVSLVTREQQQGSTALVRRTLALAGTKWLPTKFYCLVV